MSVYYSDVMMQLRYVHILHKSKLKTMNIVH